jgi:hypothetical protein
MQPDIGFLLKVNYCMKKMMVEMLEVKAESNVNR